MKSAIILLKDLKDELHSAKAVAFHELIDKPVIEYIIDYLSAAEFTDINFVVDDKEAYQKYDSDTVHFKTFNYVEDLESLTHSEQTLLINGCYPLIHEGSLALMLEQEEDIVRLDDMEVYLLKNQHLNKFAAKEEDDLIEDVYSVDPLSMYEALVINNRSDLVYTIDTLSKIINEYWIDHGVTITNSDTTLIGLDVEIGMDTIIEGSCKLFGCTKVGQNTIIGSGTQLLNATIGDDCFINSSLIEDSVVHNHVKVGPNAHFRMQTEVYDHAKVGNFVEFKNTTFGAYSSASHLTYLGDTSVGEHVNIGCLVVTVNYDGIKKNKTKIGDYSFVGSGCNLIAPITIGDKVVVAAGSTITDDVEDDAMGIARTDQVNKPGSGKKYLEREE